MNWNEVSSEAHPPPIGAGQFLRSIEARYDVRFEPAAMHELERLAEDLRKSVASAAAEIAAQSGAPAVGAIFVQEAHRRKAVPRHLVARGMLQGVGGWSFAGSSSAVAAMAATEKWSGSGACIAAALFMLGLLTRSRAR